MTLTAHGDLFAFSCSISPLPTGEWECKFRGVPITGYAPTAEDAACRRFTRVVDERKPRLLDLFCGAGGAGRGYQQAGFHVTGVDLHPQPRYAGDVFIQGDALEYLAAHGHEYDAIHASPPCQSYSVTRTLHTNTYPDLVAPVRQLLKATGKPYAIENVPGAPLHNALTLCGTMFGLRVIRHRLFETNPPIYFPPALCNHVHKTAKRGEYDRGQHGYITVAGHNFNVPFARLAMGIDWMTRDELAESIPPAYTEWIGKQLMTALKQQPAEMKVSA